MITARQILQPETAPPGPPRVLCVDDEPGVLRSLQRLLRHEPFDLLTTESPEEALEWIAGGGIRLVVADQRMPVMTGTQLLDSTRLVSPGTMGVILTAYPEVHLLLESANLSVRRLLFKPWDDEDLKGTLRELVTQGDRADPQMPRPWAGAVREGRSHEADRMIEELVVRIDCRGRTATDAVRPISALMRHPRARHSGLAIVLDHLPGLADSSDHFLDLLIRGTERSGIRPSVIDLSGRAREHLLKLGNGWPYHVFGPPFDATRARRHLIVEPDPARRELLGTLVHATGGTWDGAGSADDGILRLDTARYDRIILTLPHPGGPAAQVGRHVHQHGLPVPILLLSPSLENWDTDDCSRLGIERILPEPFRVPDFIGVVEGN